MRVKVKEWAELAQQHKVVADGHIILKESNEVFSPMMVEFCGKEYDVSSRVERIGLRNFDAFYLKGLGGWVFPAECLDRV